MNHNKIVIVFGLVLAALTTTPAHAQRVYVASQGSDANNCSLQLPCRSLQHAVSVSESGGEIAILDTGGYNGGTTVTINKAISIVNQGGYEAGISFLSSVPGIVINAGPNDAVSLRGLTIEGAGIGSNGIVFSNGASLTVDNCVVQNFHTNDSQTGNGIIIAPVFWPMTFAITNTRVSNNGYAGVLLQPPSGSPGVKGVIDHVVAVGNNFGIAFDTGSTSTSGGTVSIAISNSITSNNSANGIWATNQNVNLSLSIDNTVASNNHDFGLGLSSGSGHLRVSIDGVKANGNTNGIDVSGGTTVLLGRSTLVNNLEYGVNNGTNPNTFYTYNDNHMDLNGLNDVSGTALNSLPPH